MMENEWFGSEPWAPICAGLQRAPIPVGRECAWCHERIGVEDSGLLMVHLGQKCAQLPYHCECQARMLLGSLAHLDRRCSCFVDGADGRLPAGMSKRQEAIAVWERSGQR